MSYTTNYNLQTWSTSEITDTFANFVTGTVGDINSSMVKIDTQMKASADAIDAVKLAPIKTVSATKISTSYYTATVSGYSAYVSGNLFILKLSDTCSDTLTLNINSLGTISVMKYKSDGSIYNLSSGDIIAGVPVIISYDGTRWILINDIESGEISTTTDSAISGILKGESGKIAQAVAGTDYMSMSGGTMSGAINEAMTSSMALAGTMAIGAAAGNYIIVTAGTGPITAFDSAPAGARRFMCFTVSATINYNATTMIIPGANNFNAADGDVLEWVSYGGGVWRCVNIEKFNRDWVQLWSGTWSSGSITIGGYSNYREIAVIINGIPIPALVSDSGATYISNQIADDTYLYTRAGELDAIGDTVTINATYPLTLTTHTRAGGTHAVGAAQTITSVYGIRMK